MQEQKQKEEEIEEYAKKNQTKPTSFNQRKEGPRNPTEKECRMGKKIQTGM